MNFRLDNLRQKLAEQQLDAILISRPENLRYLSGFTGGEGFLFVTADEALACVDFRYYEQVEKQCLDFALTKIETKFSELFPKLVAASSAKRVGFESTHLTFDSYQILAGTVPEVEFVATKDVVESLRAVKDASEVTTLKHAIKLGDAAFAHALRTMRPGMRERDVAWEIEVYMRTHGGEKVAFDLIVASGPNGAMPHAVAGNRKLREGEPIVIDIGVVIDGYHSDLTRTVCLGKPDAKFREIHALVLAAQVVAEHGIRAGMSCKDADALARDIIAAAGYGDAFGHGLGHGVGLAVHELPTVGKLSEGTIEAGMIFTVEPGVYIPGWGGVRIEDVVLVTNDDVQVLSRVAKRMSPSARRRVSRRR